MPKAKVRREFCVSCGASFPPRYGEGRCVSWERCARNQGWMEDKESNILIAAIIGLLFAVALFVFGANYATASDTSLPKEVRVVWHRVADPWRECLAAYPKGMGQNYRARLMLAGGCYVMRGDVCHVYAPDGPDAQLAILGHELKHCFDGNFHP